MIHEPPEFRIVGDTGLLVRFGDDINRETNRIVHQLARRLDADHHPGIIETIPAYNSLLINYDPTTISLETCKRIALDSISAGDLLGTGEYSCVEIPVLYGLEFGPDIEFVAERNGIGVDDVVKIHSSREYTVYMLGFTPGFAYLGGMSEKISAPRLDTPRSRVEPGSIGIANSQTGIYPISSAGGWRLIGRTPLRLFRPAGKRPFLYQAGDTIIFRPITYSEYETLSRENV